jgi:putative transposase
MNYRHGSYTVFQIEYHFVWVIKYRYKILKGEIAGQVRAMVRQACETFEIPIVRDLVINYHLHILVNAPPILHPVRLCRRSEVKRQVDCPRN